MNLTSRNPFEINQSITIKKTNMNNKKLATAQTYNPNDLASTGYDITLYADGSVAAESHSRWQGSRDGERFRSDPGTVDLERLDPDDEDNDAEALLAAFVSTFDPYEDLPDCERAGNYGFRQTRLGYIVQ